MNIRTPKKDIKHLPDNATALDFAFYVHTDLAFHCAGVCINGVNSSLDTSLKEGDIVEVLTSSECYPKREWFEIIKTSKARSALKHYDWFIIDALEYKKKYCRRLVKLQASFDEQLDFLKSQMKYLHTRVLLKELRKTYSDGYFVDYDCEEECTRFIRKKQNLLKEELATREHIPNKKENKAKRLLRIKNRNPRSRRNRKF